MSLRYASCLHQALVCFCSPELDVEAKPTANGDAVTVERSKIVRQPPKSFLERPPSTRAEPRTRRLYHIDIEIIRFVGQFRASWCRTMKTRDAEHGRGRAYPLLSTVLTANGPAGHRCLVFRTPTPGTLRPAMVELSRIARACHSCDPHRTL